MSRIMYLRQCPEPEESPEEHCDCECRNSRNYSSCYEECMIDYGEYEGDDEGDYDA